MIFGIVVDNGFTVSPDVDVVPMVLETVALPLIAFPIHAPENIILNDLGVSGDSVSFIFSKPPIPETCPLAV